MRSVFPILSFIALFFIASCNHEACDIATCLNDATCDEGICVCADGFVGDHCESFDKCMKSTTDCNGFPCVSGTCQCEDGMEGEGCETFNNAFLHGKYYVIDFYAPEVAGAFHLSSFDLTSMAQAPGNGDKEWFDLDLLLNQRFYDLYCPSIGMSWDAKSTDSINYALTFCLSRGPGHLWDEFRLRGDGHFSNDTLYIDGTLQSRYWTSARGGATSYFTSSSDFAFTAVRCQNVNPNNGNGRSGAPSDPCQ